MAYNERSRASKRRGFRHDTAVAVLLVLAVTALGLSVGQQAPAAAAGLENRNPAQAGATLPVKTTITSLPGKKIFVAPGGNDSGTGAQNAPLKTLPKAVSRAAAGDSIVLRGGTYPIAANRVTVNKKVTIIAYPGEIPVFDGSVAAPTSATSEGSLRWFAYKPMPAKAGEGLSVTGLPAATFSGSTPTGLAAARGWRCVSAKGSYTVPSGSGKGCPSGTTPRVITGFYPDQAWVNGKPLVQVLSKAKVVPGTFYVERSSAGDASPGNSRMYLNAKDAGSMGQVRVSSSNGTFIITAASGIRLEGLRIIRHSPAWPDSAVRVSFANNDVVLKNLDVSDVASGAVKVMGGPTANGSQITKRTTLDKVTINRAGWIGFSATYSDDTRLLNVSITSSNPDAEFVTAPKSGGIKASKTHGMQVIGSVISGNNSHGVWWDQSNYDSLLANSKLVGNRDSGVFYEISHGLTMVNNLVVVNKTTSSTPAVRLAGASGVRLVNNTIVGSQTPLVLAGDARSKKYGSGRPCVEHSQRYGGTGSISADCPPGLSSDLDMARPGAYGKVNLTPKLNWTPSAGLLVNNVLANPGSGSGGICPGGYPLCVKGYAGSATSPTVTFKTNQILAAGLLMNGNVYQAPSAVAQIRVQSGGSGGVVASSLSQYRSALASSWFKLNAEANGLAGTGWVSASGAPTAALQAKQGQAAPVPSDPTINTFVPAGSRKYGSSYAGS